ncbi:MAG TPA: hypothetical protein DEQ64_16385 [Lachnoclostridium sp.]|uniref:hypothetical protein n=1 Tax=Lacrimispora sp. TaxID=2719234 RepID=UPI000EDBFA8C|nr:hypothetical protein [Lacrimispora sp.]HCD45274.1 hypothetical protein [Lachnoclostridium sp.]
MKRKFDYFKYQRYNDKRKKPWRSLKQAIPYKEDLKIRLRKSLLVLILLEAAVFFLPYGVTIAGNAHEFLPVNREAEAEKEPLVEAFWGRKTGETKEQGFSVDWKEGRVKFWQKVERVILQGPD